MVEVICFGKTWLPVSHNGYKINVFSYYQAFSWVFHVFRNTGFLGRKMILNTGKL